VGHVELTTHFIAALGLLLHFVVCIKPAESSIKVIDTKLKIFYCFTYCLFFNWYTVLYGRPGAVTTVPTGPISTAAAVGYE
jgi:hypothetical protein